MRYKLTERQSWIVAIVVLAITIAGTFVLGFVVNRPTSLGGILSLSAFVLFLLLLLIASLYYRRKRKRRE